MEELVKVVFELAGRGFDGVEAVPEVVIDHVELLDSLVDLRSEVGVDEFVEVLKVLDVELVGRPNNSLDVRLYVGNLIEVVAVLGFADSN